MPYISAPLTMCEGMSPVLAGSRMHLNGAGHPKDFHGGDAPELSLHGKQAKRDDGHEGCRPGGRARWPPGRACRSR